VFEMPTTCPMCGVKIITCPKCGDADPEAVDEYVHPDGKHEYQFLCRRCHTDWMTNGWYGEPYNIYTVEDTVTDPLYVHKCGDPEP